MGKSTKQFNEDVGDETMADITSSAMMMKAMIVMILTMRRMSRSLYRNGELSAGGRQESKAISCVLFEM